MLPLSSCKTLHTIYKYAIRGSCAHWAAMHKGTHHVNDCTHLIYSIVDDYQNRIADHKSTGYVVERIGLYWHILQSYSPAQESDRRRWTPVKLRWMRKFQAIWYIRLQGGPSVKNPMQMSLPISSTISWNPWIRLKIWNRLSDSSRSTIPTVKLTTTSTKADASVTTTFPTPSDGRCTIKPMRWIHGCWNAEKPWPQDQTARDNCSFEIR